MQTTTVHERNVEYIPRRMKPEQATLYVVFPLEVYWPRVTLTKRVGDNIINCEGLIYPSISDIIFTGSYRIEMIDPRTFKVHHAVGYAGCPVCGRVLRSEVRDREIKLSVPLRRFTPEAAYELVLISLSSEIAYKMKSHVMYTHDCRHFEKVGTKSMYIVRYLDENQVITTAAKINVFRCTECGNDMYGVFGILEHVVTAHRNVEVAAKIRDFVRRLSETTEMLLGLTRKDIPLLGAYRNVFKYEVAKERGSEHGKPETIAYARFADWLKMRAVDLGSRVEIRLVAAIPRPIRMIYHYVLFRYVPHIIAYRLNPKLYLRFMDRVKSEMRERGYDPANVERMLEVVTGVFRYTPVRPVNAFTVNLDLLERLRSIAERLGENLKLFMARRGTSA